MHDGAAHRHPQRDAAVEQPAGGLDLDVNRRRLPQRGVAEVDVHHSPAAETGAEGKLVEQLRHRVGEKRAALLAEGVDDAVADQAAEARPRARRRRPRSPRRTAPATSTPPTPRLTSPSAVRPWRKRSNANTPRLAAATSDSDRTCVSSSAVMPIVAAADAAGAPHDRQAAAERQRQAERDRDHRRRGGAARHVAEPGRADDLAAVGAAIGQRADDLGVASRVRAR